MINSLSNKSLKYFMITKKLNKRQTKWAKFLIEFDFKIAYQSEKKNDKTNSLIKRLEDRLIDELNDRNKHMHQNVLSSEKVDSRILQKFNDIEKENSELSLFDKVKLTNQKNMSRDVTIHNTKNAKVVY
jgi:hypothetical protein